MAFHTKNPNRKIGFSWADDTFGPPTVTKSFVIKKQPVIDNDSLDIIKGKRKVTQNICCHFIYNGSCTLPNCSRIHSRNISDIRMVIKGFKKYPCKFDFHCNNAVCFYKHSLDDHFFHNSGESFTFDNDIMQQRDKYRHIAYVSDGNKCNLNPCPFC